MSDAPPEEASFQAGRTESRRLASTEDLASNNLDDLIHSWRRITDPRLRKMALTLLRAMADDAAANSPQSH